MVLSRSLKMTRVIRSIFLICLSMSCCLCLILNSLSPSAYAADFGPIYNPKEYVSDSYISNGYKYFDLDFFDTPRVWYRYLNGEQTSYVPGANTSLITIDEGTVWTTASLKLMLFGVANAVDYSCRGGVLDIHAVSHGAPVTFNFSGNIVFNSRGQTFTVRLVFGVYKFASTGEYLGVSYDEEFYDYSGTGISITKSADMAVEFDADGKTQYVAPYVQLYLENADAEGETVGKIEVRIFSLKYGSSLAVNLDDYNSALQDDIYNTLDDLKNEQGETNDKLDDIGGQLGDVNDNLNDIEGELGESNNKLDHIISGGEAGEQLGGSGTQLEGSSGVVSGEAGNLSGDIGSVDQFESGVMSDIDSSFNKIDVVTGVGSFKDSLLFVSGLAQNVFVGVDDWQVAITLPLFLGLFFGVCQHVGGVSNMRARHAREARNEELHQARLEKIRNGGKK